MELKRSWVRTGAVMAVCAAAGAGAGIAGSAAAPKASGTTTATGSSGAASTSPSTAAGRAQARRGARGRLFGRGPAVHAEVVVLNKAGDGWVTQTMDHGRVKSVSGDELVVAEGTAAVPYKDVTLTIPAAATITRNGKMAELSALKAGDDVHVVSSTEGTTVFAADETFRPRGRGHHGPGRGHHGPPPAGTFPGAP